MDGISSNPLLQQLQGLATQAANRGTVSIQSPAAAAEGGGDFSKILKTEIDKVNEIQQHSAAKVKAYEQGDPSVSLPEVMIAMQKSSIAFQSLLQVRNHVIQAYKDVMNMPI